MATDARAAYEWLVKEIASEVVARYDMGYSPERAADYLLRYYRAETIREAVEHAAQFSEHYFGAQNDAWTAAVLATIREEEG